MEDYSKYSFDELNNCFQAVFDYLVNGQEPNEEMLELLSRGEYADYVAKRDQARELKKDVDIGERSGEGN